MRSPPTKVVIADSQPVMISGLAYELQRDPNIQVVGTARSPGDLVDMLTRRECDVVISDYTMSSGCEKYSDGIAMLSLIRRRHPGVGLVVFTAIDNPGVIRSLLSKHISCIFSKRDHADEMPAAVRAAKSEEAYLSPVIASIVRESKTDAPTSNRGLALTPRELEVVRLFVSGLTINEIAARLRRSKQTISSQKNNAMRKMSIKRNIDLIKYAVDTKLACSISATAS
ncbi:bacterial regulatory s, luxR family protein [Burkholderia thailandensis MSMB121]|nr:MULTISPECIES: response regulator transcription factor [Burkholderia]AGK49726.1 bacterial regulatory s, luxR family protein [Burkholderia thailandensis MSMB121]AJY40428.1 bacterial regulatory s, luxR family protein [Burkholderia sp. 2002721687]ATF32290.1 DNA-binding response regulator [Burkholderia thailandensis]